LPPRAHGHHLAVLERKLKRSIDKREVGHWLQALRQLLKPLQKDLATLPFAMQTQHLRFGHLHPWWYMQEDEQDFAVHN